LRNKMILGDGRFHPAGQSRSTGIQGLPISETQSPTMERK
jgi:hypothetical protein